MQGDKAAFYGYVRCVLCVCVCSWTKMNAECGVRVCLCHNDGLPSQHEHAKFNLISWLWSYMYMVAMDHAAVACSGVRVEFKF
jgi:hypothetical protein